MRRNVIVSAAAPFGNDDVSSASRGTDEPTMMKLLQRELRIAFSRRGQPLWFRIGKWIFFLGTAAAFYGSEGFGYWIAGLLLAGLTVHLIYRWRTRGWTRPWGGWDDLEAGR
jgi:hypothetical protein